METIAKVNIKLIHVDCYKCGVIFGIPNQLHDMFLDTGTTFFCPSGHNQHYTTESQRDRASRLNNQLKEANRYRKYFEDAYSDEAEDHRSTRRSLSATKAAHTRTKNRIKNGVCPCCNRHFANLQGHMKTKHPNYNEQ